MKKVLLTTSALTLLAGAAAAVDVGGYARIGIQNSGGTTTNYLRNQITFTGSASTDGGLTMSTWTRYRHSASSSLFAGTGAFAAPRISVSNGAMTSTAGNAGGALNANAGIWGCGAAMWGCSDLLGAGIWDWASTSSTGAGPNVVRLDMGLGGASVSVSGGNGNDTEFSVSVPAGSGSIGIGYDQNSSHANGQTTHLNYSGTASGMSVGVKLAQVQGGNTGYIGSVTAPMGGGSVYVFAGKNLQADNVYGLRYNQSLGGGASLQAGMTSDNGTTTVGAGVAFGF